MEKYYKLNGIPVDKPGENDFWILEWNNNFVIKEGDNTSDLDFKLVGLTNRLSEIMYGSVHDFYKMLSSKSIWYSYAGVDAELKISKQMFSDLVQANKSVDTNKLLYYYDFHNLIGSLQNLVQESKFLFCDFYKNLNQHSFMLMDKPLKPDILMFASGQMVTSIFSKINHLFINLSSQLDFITKIAFEFENIPKDYSDYPKLKANNILYGDAKKIKNIEFDGTLFERTSDVKLVINMRNEIIHNASFEGISKVYQVFESGIMIEKYILIPDSTDGNFDSFRNRNRFFYNDVKLNEVLPTMLSAFWNKMASTVEKIAVK